MSALAISVDVFGPVPFRMHVAVGALAAFLWLIVLPLELALA